MHFKLSWQSTAILGLLFSFTASAQATNNVTSLENIVVTPSRTAQLESEVVGDVTVIDSAELERAGQSSVAEILSKQPGVQFYSSGGSQSNTGVYLRGTNPKHTLVLIDGIRINSAATGAVNWNTIDPNLIERIEIVRGAGSSLYGSGAIGGVINIITKKGDQTVPFSAWGNMGFGSYDTFKSSAGISGAANGWDYAFSASIADSEGFSATNKDHLWGSYHKDKDGYSQHGFSGSLGYSWAPEQHIGIKAYNSYINADYDNGEFDWMGNSSHPAITITRQQAYAITSTNKISEYWNSQLSLGFSRDQGEDRQGQMPSDRFGMLQRTYTWQNEFTLNNNHSVTALFERLEERLQSSTEHNKDKRNTNSVALIYVGKFDALRTQASVRNDNISGYGNKKTGSLGFDYDFAPEWSVGILASTGFSAPSFDQLYYPGFSNANLKPEKSRNIESSLAYSGDSTHLKATIYQNNIKDLIGNDSNFTPININKARIKGLTLTGSHQIGNTTLHASADFLDPKDRATGKQLVRRAKQVYNLGINHQIYNWDLGAEYQFVGKRYEDPANEIRLGGHSLYNLTAAYDFSRNVGVQVRWNNIFNKRYSNAYGYNMPGSNVFINLSFKM